MIQLHSCYVRDMDDTWKMPPSPSQYNVLILISNGRLIYYVNDEEVELKTGEVLYIPAGSVRGGVSVTTHQRYATHFSLEENDGQLLPMLTERKPVHLQLRSFDYFKQRFSLLMHHWQMKGPYQSTTCFAVLLEMLSLMNYDLDNWKIGEQKQKMVEAMKNYLVTHYNEPITLNDIAKHIGRSPNYASYTFKKVTGFSPVEYMHHLRISKAKDLLLSASLPIREVAEMTGFCDQAYFNRVFKKVTGYSPTAFLYGKS